MSDISIGSLLGKRVSILDEEKVKNQTKMVTKSGVQLYDEAFVLYNNKQYEDAANLFFDAIELLKTELNFSLCGQCYEMIIKCTSENDEYDEQSKSDLNAQYYDQAGMMFNKSQETLKSIICYAKSLEIYQNSIHKVKIIPSIATKLGELYTLVNDYNNALTYYKLAASSRMTHSPECTSSIDHDLLNVADTLVMLGDYANAIPIYEQIAESHKTNMLLKWSTKVHYFKASYCRLLTTTKQELPNTANIITNYFNDPFNQGTRELVFITVILDTLSEFGKVNRFNSVERYTTLCEDYNSLFNDPVKDHLASAFALRWFNSN